MTDRNRKPCTLEEFRDLLKRHGLKATPQRLAVHRAMSELGHTSADKVAEKIRQEGDTDITVASIYNILSQLASLGVYSRRLSANNKMYFDVNASKHLHLYDTENHTFRDVADNGLLELVESSLARRRFRGFRVDGVDIQIICHPSRKRNCRKP